MSLDASSSARLGTGIVFLQGGKKSEPDLTHRHWGALSMGGGVHPVNNCGRSA